MTSLSPSLHAHRHLRAAMTLSSWEAGWRSLLLRGYVDPPEVEEFKTPATADHLIVLVTDGACDIEARYRGRWQSAHYEPGHIGMTAPGQEATLRWRGQTTHSTLQLHLPTPTLQRVFRDLSAGDPERLEMPSMLGSVDPLVQQIMLGLARALSAGVPDLYAESAGELLAAHLLVHHASRPAPRPVSARDTLRLRRVEAFMREHLGEPLSLETLAQQAGVSRFHLLRLFKRANGETPFARLTRLRIEEAQCRLARGRQSVTEIALACGYQNPAHFASAFRRLVGVSPTSYRRGAR
ncbi:AraC family transcriptional regulator [Polyangium sp. 15x6]|uniref:AraC family transcriptional regulator n=1 Tax=Polyangium sp. 15x6 TaxID=3042687 RepID=UPI00249C71A4|nr:AraC family transcriptional regulator [Polyangium sp. 15x6]MDI3287796.1 AraC family transcriptional regulator [Polyangium sp. 15x6]